MRAAVLKDNYRIVLEDVKEPSPGPGEVKIQVRVTGICGSEVHAFKGTHPYRKPPVILGHELAGDIVEVGSDVEGLKVGDRVTVEPQIGCERCYMCRRGLNNLCESKIVLGTQEWPGSFAEYIIAPAKVVYRLPDGLSYEEGVMVEPLAVGVHAVRWSEMGLGDSVLVLGAGTIGLVTIMAARQAGARRIFATDVLDFNLAKAKELGATHTINVRQEDPAACPGRDEGQRRGCGLHYRGRKPRRRAGHQGREEKGQSFAHRLFRRARRQFGDLPADCQGD